MKEAQNNQHSWGKLFFAILAGVFSSIVCASALNRFFHFFFYCTFISSIVGCIVTLSILSLRKVAENNSVTLKFIIDKILILSSCISLLISFSFLTTIPLNVDRSFSVWMINYMNDNDGKKTATELQRDAYVFFAPEKGEIQRRIEEQIRLGNMEVNDGKIELTSSGKRLAKINKFIRQLFALNSKYTS